MGRPKYGVPMSGVEISPGHGRRRRKRRTAQERKWARMAGPVAVTYLSGREPDREEEAGPNR